MACINTGSSTLEEGKNRVKSLSLTAGPEPKGNSWYLVFQWEDSGMKMKGFAGKAKCSAEKLELTEHAAGTYGMAYRALSRLEGDVQHL
jgi:hypothetical protein